jgi:hypothetical protein
MSGARRCRRSPRLEGKGEGLDEPKSEGRVPKRKRPKLGVRRAKRGHDGMSAIGPKQTIGESYDAGWRVRVRCDWGPRDGMKRRRECVFGGELDLFTLAWTRGRKFPLGMLESRLKCPRCGSGRVVLLFEPPPTRDRLWATRF